MYSKHIYVIEVLLIIIILICGIIFGIIVYDRRMEKKKQLATVIKKEPNDDDKTEIDEYSDDTDEIMSFNNVREQREFENEIVNEYNYNSKLNNNSMPHIIEINIRKDDVEFDSSEEEVDVNESIKSPIKEVVESASEVVKEVKLEPINKTDSSTNNLQGSSIKEPQNETPVTEVLDESVNNPQETPVTDTLEEPVNKEEVVEVTINKEQEIIDTPVTDTLEEPVKDEIKKKTKSKSYKKSKSKKTTKKVTSESSELLE